MAAYWTDGTTNAATYYQHINSYTSDSTSDSWLYPNHWYSYPKSHKVYEYKPKKKIYRKGIDIEKERERWRRRWEELEVNVNVNIEVGSKENDVLPDLVKEIDGRLVKRIIRCENCNAPQEKDEEGNIPNRCPYCGN